MTAIGAWRWEGLPILVGDLAVSGIDDESSAVVPTIKSVERQFPKGSGRVVTGVTQKLVVIGDSLAVGWAGPLVAATEALTLLKDLGAAPQSPDAIESALSNLSVSRLSRELVIVGWTRSDAKWIGFAFDDMRFRLMDAEEVFTDGTGGDALRDAQLWASKIQVPDGTPTMLTCAARAIGMTGQLVRTELSFRNALLEYFGAGYEVVSVRGDRLAKLDVATQLFLDAELVGGDLRLRVLRVMRSYYVGDRLVVRAADADFRESRHRVKLFDHELHVISPPDAPPFPVDGLADVPVKSFSAPIISSHTLLRSEGFVRGIVNTITTQKVAVEDTKADELSLSDELYELIMESIRKSDLLPA